MDNEIPGAIASLVDAFLGIITGVGVVVVSSPIYLLAIVPLTYQYLRYQAQYRVVSKELKKMDSGARSPLFSHFRETFGGLETIHAYGIEARFDRLCRRVFTVVVDGWLWRQDWINIVVCTTGHSESQLCYSSVDWN